MRKTSYQCHEQKLSSGVVQNLLVSVLFMLNFMVICPIFLLFIEEHTTDIVSLNRGAPSHLLVILYV